MKSNNASKTVVLILTLVLLAGLVGTSALADNAGTDMTMNKYLIMAGNATVPTATFSYTIAAGTAATLTVDGKTQYILAGVGAPTVGATAFTATTATATTVAAADTADVTLAAGQKYAKVESTISFTGVTFPAPGVYRYVITEAATSVPGVTNDANTTRILDVYVGYADTAAEASQTLTILGKVLHNSTADALTGTAYDGKKTGFTNSYTTNDLTLSKMVAGNQGYRSQYFPFIITLGGTGITGTYTIQKGDGSAMDTTTEIPGFGTATNPGTITVGTPATVYLKHGERIKIIGLPTDTTFIFEEDKTSCADYTTTAELMAVAYTAHLTNPTQTLTVADGIRVDFTNTRNGIVPTGILLDVWPYLLIVAIAGVALVVLLRSKRKSATR